MRSISLSLLCCFSLLSTISLAADWTRFRGPNGTGISPDGPAPIEWSESKNLKWKTPLPGPGSSSPIVVGDKVFVTCWTGYGVGEGDPGDKGNLKLHLICLSRQSGDVLWKKDVDPTGLEEDYRGMFAQHGYASHTPVSDGEHVFAFFGKSGVVAFDMDGNRQWERSVGVEDGVKGWGSSSSPILFEDKVIVPATAESQALVALDKKTGEEIWSQEAQGFAGTWGTPIVVDLEDGKQELVIGVPYEVWAFNPESGKLRWYAEVADTDSFCSSVIEKDGVIYLIEGRSGGSAAVKAGGKGDMTKDVLWTGRSRGRISTPVFYDGKIIWISGGIISALDPKTGDQLFQVRMQSGSSSDRSSGSRDRGGRRGGGFGGQDYSSPVIAGDKMYYVRRSGETSVIDLSGDEPTVIATNQFDSDGGDFSGTPAISDGELFIRSSNNIYCVAAE